MSLPEDFESPEIEIYPAEPPRPRRGFSMPLAILLAGVAILACVAVFEERWASEQPWFDALLLPDAVIDAEGRVPVWVRESECRGGGTGNVLIETLQAELDRDHLGFQVDKPEPVVAVELPVEDLAPLIDSGRLPQPGKPEVLAGELARETPFQLDGQWFTIVGRLKQGVSGFPAAYLLPFDPGVEGHFNAAAGAKRGSLFLDGMTRMEDLMPKDGAKDGARAVMGGQTRAKSIHGWGAVAGLLLVALGGAIAYVRFFHRLAELPSPLLGPVLRETVRRQGLMLGMHLLLYGIFFGAMSAGMLLPYWNYRITEYMGLLFTKGELSYIGQAYASGDILQATAATFINNYVVQTLGLTFAISIIPLALGVLKTALSFAVVGFGMAPLWSGAASGYAYHSITMVLELEAYILACFVVVVWPIRLWRAVTRGSFPAEFFLNLRIVLGGALLAGGMLAVAALYEATTLILLRGF